MEREANAEFKTSWVEYISHEMRTPLGIISMGLELTKSSVLEGTKDPADILSTLSDLEVPCNKAVGLLDQLLYLERLEKNEVHLELKTYSPLQLLHEAARGVEKLASEHGVSLKAQLLEKDMHFDAKNLRVKVDVEKVAFLLRQILSFTIARLKCGDEVFVELEIVMSKKTGQTFQQKKRRPSFLQKYSSIVPILLDDCFLRINIPLPEKLSRFDEHILASDDLKFERVANEDNHSYGLGIFIGKRVMEMHHGTLSAGSSTLSGIPSILLDLPLSLSIDIRRSTVGFDAIEEGHATLNGVVDLLHSECKQQTSEAFHSRKLNSKRDRGSQKKDPSSKDAMLAVGDVSASNPVNLRDASRALSACADDEGMTVLVVDDSALTRKILIKVMLSMGHHCTEAEDGSIAVEMIRQSLQSDRCYDVILMDNVRIANLMQLRGLI